MGQDLTGVIDLRKENELIGSIYNKLMKYSAFGKPIGYREDTVVSRFLFIKRKIKRIALMNIPKCWNNGQWLECIFSKYYVNYDGYSMGRIHKW